MSQATFPPARATTSIHVKVSVDPSNAAAFLADLKKAQSEVITYPENVSWDLYHNPEAPGEFKYIENWNASLEWVMAAAAVNKACQEYFAKTETMLTKPREMEVWIRRNDDGWSVRKS